MSDSTFTTDEILQGIEKYETELELRRQDKLDEKIFAEIRLRRGVYGQRYDNGQSHDGIETRQLQYPSGDLLKGPNTMWDAPGMQRIKVPFGGLTPEQLEVIAELAEEFSDDIAHVTTRQDFQLHYVHIDDTPEIMRRLADVGITTQEACGNVVRNVTACPIAGVCHDETFDITPYAQAMTRFLLGHPDAQDFGRKFKIAFSGCGGHACGLASMHDFGAIARTCVVNGQTQRGFEVFVGGGLGAVPHKARLLSEFVPEEELLPLMQAIARVFARLGEKKNRARARIKFLVQKLGIDEFRRLVLEERATLKFDPRWTDYLESAHQFQEQPRHAAGQRAETASTQMREWFSTNVYSQKQGGYATVSVNLPLGDITAQQLRKLADIAREYTNGAIRTTVEQNIVLRWVREDKLSDLFVALSQARLAAPGAGTMEDITTCPGTDTCKLGIASSRGLAAQLQKQFAEGLLRNGADSNGDIPDIIRDLHIKISGCFNSCGQHHIADLGFYGVNRKVGSHMVPHFQVVLGGQWAENAGAFGLAIGAAPSKNIPKVVQRIVRRYAQERRADETFQAFTRRIGKAEIRKTLEDLIQVPAYESNPEFYSDWGDPREFTIGDMGVGECAGEVVSAVEFELTAAEREVFEAQLALDDGDAKLAGEKAFAAMLRAARGLVQTSVPDIPDDVERVASEFRTGFYDTRVFFDPFAKGKFARYFLDAVAAGNGATGYDEQTVHQRIEEAHLFVEAALACYTRMHSS